MRRADIERLLPEVISRTIRDESPMGSLLGIMELMHVPAEKVLDDVEVNFSPRRCRDRFVRLLASWVDLDVPVTTGIGRHREWINRAVELSHWRGTGRGLRASLETATGVTGFEFDESVPGPDGLPRPFHMKVSVPEKVKAHRDMVVAIIEREKPAYVTYEIEFT